MMHFYDGGFYMGFGGIWMVLWWALIIVGIVLLVKWLSSSSDSTGQGNSKALEILKERYARGEIDEQEYQKKKQDLTQ